MPYAAPRGTKDILPEEILKWQYIENLFRDICQRYGYREIRTPMFEETELFIHSTGETTDIVQKQMYTFTDRGGRSLALRPEGTPPVVRAYIQHGLNHKSPIAKYYYIAPIFRFERPQAGRYRQHHQVGIEAIGSNDPRLDAEVIILGSSFLQALQLKDAEIQFNSIGCRQCRPKYKQALKEHLASHLANLCTDCQKRYETNPLRILDCKRPTCRKQLKNVPKILEYLCQDCKDHFQQVTNYLQLLGTKYSINPLLVRGLDYYTRTTFEIIHSQLGAQNALLGGGRYDDLIEACGGPSIPAIGFGCGLERTILVMDKLGIKLPIKDKHQIFIATIGEEAQKEGLKLLFKLRQAGISAETDYLQRSLKAQMKFAHKINAKYTIILGEDELKEGMVTLRDMATGDQKKIKSDHLVELLTLKEENKSL